MNSLEINVLQILSVQNDSFLAKSDSSCFIAAGIELSDDVNKAFKNLEDQKYIEYMEEVTPTSVMLVEHNADGSWLYEEDGVTPKWKLDEDGKPIIEEQNIVSDTGWKITDLGREALVA